MCHNFFPGLTTYARVQVESLVFGCAGRIFNIKTKCIRKSSAFEYSTEFFKVIAHGWCLLVIKQNQVNFTEGQAEGPLV